MQDLLTSKKLVFTPCFVVKGSNNGNDSCPMTSTAVGTGKLTNKIGRVMKLTFILLFIAGMAAHGNTVAQKISLDVKNEKVEDVLKEIRKQSGYSFAYFEVFLQNMKPVTLKVTNVSINEVMDLLLKGSGYTYSITERTIALSPKKKESPIAENIPMSFPPITIRGKVINKEGEPVAGVTVQIKGTKIATATDGEGEFELNKVDPNGILVLSAVNIQTIEAPIDGKSEVTIRVTGKTGKLDEVQVIAYGKTSQRFTTGNVYSVKGEDIEKQPVSNPLLTLQGRVPGLVVTQSSGVSGSAVTVRVQGRNNLDAGFTGSDPLIVVDGVPYPSQNLYTYLGGMGVTGILGQNSGAYAAPGSPLSFINPADIESIDILKDADATSIYGSRAANGAILITTKKGKADDARIDINVQTGWGQVAHKLDFFNTQQYLAMRREAFKNDNLPIPSIITSPADNKYDVNGLWDTTRYTDWQDQLIGGTSTFTRLSASMSGGSRNTTYLVGGTYNHETTVYPQDFANVNGSLHFNINATNNDKRLSLQLTGSVMSGNNKLPGLDFTQFITLAPVAPSLYKSDGTLNWQPNPLGNSSWNNPLSNNYNIFESKSINLIGNAILGYKILPGLEIKTSLGYNLLTTDQFIGSLDKSYKPELLATLNRRATFSNNAIKSWIAEPQLTYNFNWRRLKIDALVGATFQEKLSDGNITDAFGQSSDVLLKNRAAATSYSQATSNAVYRYNAAFGRLSLNMSNRYLINLSARRDGSSRFGSNNLFHNFWSAGAGWIFSEEALIKKYIQFLSFGKVRGSYGIAGNDQITDYLFMNLYSSTINQIAYQSIKGLSPVGIVNPNLQWEETKKMQLGIDLGFFKDRVLLSGNYFRNRTSNTLTIVNLPWTTGAQGFTANFPALIQNAGWEILLKTDNIRGKHITWTSSINVTIPRNKLVSFPGIETSIFADIFVVGQPLSITKSFQFYGVDPQTGSYLLTDSKGNITMTPNSATDLFAIQNTSEAFYGGIQNTFTWDGFQLDFLFQFTKQMGFNNFSIRIPGAFSSSILGNELVSVLDRWQKPGDITSTSRFTTITNPIPISGNRAFGDASYIRLKNLSLAWNFPKKVLNKLHLRGVRIFTNGQNLFTITPYKGLDPETQSILTLPPLRVITIGAQVTL